jgi:hypothetical protein
MKQLERLLLFQGNRCFFCHELIPPGEASVEHLVATANGGAKDDENCAVCCKTLNAALGSLSIKAKLQVVVNQRGTFVCPHNRGAESVAQTTEHPAEPEDKRLQLVVADLQKRGSARPRRLATLKNTIGAMFQKKLSEEELSFLVAVLETRGYVKLQDNKVTYALPQPDA